MTAYKEKYHNCNATTLKHRDSTTTIGFAHTYGQVLVFTSAVA